MLRRSGLRDDRLDSASLGGWVPGARPGDVAGRRGNEAAGERAQSCCRFTITRTIRIRFRTKREIGVYYAKKTPEKILRILPLANTSFTIPPGDANYRVTRRSPASSSRASTSTSLPRICTFSASG